ncbi:BlaI/MecI/CopY family transcriptional regulator [Nocardioides hungaricus]
MSKRSRRSDGKAAARTRPLGDLEAVVMGHLWSAETPLTVREVLQRIEREPPLAYTTVLTVVDNLYRKGFLVREREGRAFRYRPTKDRADHAAELMHELLSDSGDASATLLRFLDHMDPGQVARLRRVLRD